MSGSDQAAVDLLASVRADPDDDLPRLVYADWLDRYGGRDGALRAEFIRLQIELESLDPSFPDTLVLERKIGWLFDQLVTPGPDYPRQPGTRVEARFAWAGVVASRFASKHLEGWTFRRGFVEEIRGPLLKLLEHAPLALSSQPVTRLRVTDKEPVINYSGPRTIFLWTHLGEAPQQLRPENHPNAIPLSLWRRMKSTKTMMTSYPDREAALDDLNYTVFLVCRERADLHHLSGG